MPGGKRPWTRAQALEAEYYRTRSASLSPAGRDLPYAAIHGSFWRGMLARLPELTFTDEGSYVDAGCGPNTILAFVERGRRVGIDPLMPLYKERFNLPAGIEFIEGRVETLAAVPPASVDVLFMMNAIDHTQDVELAARVLASRVKPGGHLVLSVNLVAGRLRHRLLRLSGGYRLLDPTHPHHFCAPDELSSRFADAFELLKVVDVQDLSDRATDAKAHYGVAPAPSRRRSLARRLTHVGAMLARGPLALGERHHLFLFRRRG